MPKLAADHRRNELAQIHIAVKDLAMADDTYRDLLWTIGRVRSSKDLDWTGRKKLIDHFKACGWKPKPARKAGTTRKLCDWAQATKIRALWLELHHLGAVENPSEEALLAFVKRMTKAEALQWLTPSEASR